MIEEPLLCSGKPPGIILLYIFSRFSLLDEDDQIWKIKKLKKFSFFQICFCPHRLRFFAPNEKKNHLYKFNKTNCYVDHVDQFLFGLSCNKCSIISAIWPCWSLCERKLAELCKNNSWINHHILQTTFRVTFLYYRY